MTVFLTIILILAAIGGVRLLLENFGWVGEGKQRAVANRYKMCSRCPSVIEPGDRVTHTPQGDKHLNCF